MIKLVKDFLGVRTGNIYPTQFRAGDDCPPELLDAANALGALAQEKKMEKASENKMVRKSPESKMLKASPENKAG